MITEVLERPASIRFRPSPSGRGMRLEAVQFLPRSPDELFEFFGDAMQLETITPQWLNFKVLTAPPLKIEEGSLIDYRLRIRGFPLRWQSRISVWEPPVCFVDEQIRGPYLVWHHEHRFEPTTGGTLCHDVVDYAVPGGALIERWLVRPDLQRIFRFRQEKLNELFASANA